MISKNLAIALEAVGISAITCGIVIEALMHADFGFVVITGGSLLVAGGGMIWAKLVKRGG